MSTGGIRWNPNSDFGYLTPAAFVSPASHATSPSNVGLRRRPAKQKYKLKSADLLYLVVRFGGETP